MAPGSCTPVVSIWTSWKVQGAHYDGAVLLSEQGLVYPRLDLHLPGRRRVAVARAFHASLEDVVRQGEPPSRKAMGRRGMQQIPRLYGAQELEGGGGRGGEQERWNGLSMYRRTRRLVVSPSCGDTQQ